jgi:curved DNA-binding protein CbpA
VDDEQDAYAVLQVRPEADDVVIRAAYRALAALHHPDRDSSASATHRMAALNDAYNRVRTSDRRAAYDRLRGRKRPADPAVVTAPGQRAPAGSSGPAEKPGPGTIDFGRYAGWTIRQLARQDPDYLRWLARHSSGIRFRRQIEEALKADAPPKPEATRRGRR